MDMDQTSMVSDADLVARVLAGDQEQYSELVRRHQGALYRHALGMVGYPDAAADLVQDSFVKAYTSLAHCQDPARYGAWVFRILRNRCLDHLKDLRQQTVPIQESTAYTSERDDPESQMERTEMRVAITNALASLPDGQREAFLLKHVDGRSYEEMADMLGASVSALKMRVMRAREALQQQLGGEQRHSAKM